MEIAESSNYNTHFMWNFSISIDFHRASCAQWKYRPNSFQCLIVWPIDFVERLSTIQYRQINTPSMKITTISQQNRASINENWYAYLDIHSLNIDFISFIKRENDKKSNESKVFNKIPFTPWKIYRSNTHFPRLVSISYTTAYSMALFHMHDVKKK